MISLRHVKPYFSPSFSALDYPPFLCYSGFGRKSVKCVPLGSMCALMYQDWSLNLATFADDLLSDDFVAYLFAYQLTLPSSHSSFNALMVRSKSNLRSLAMSKVSASLCRSK